MGLDFTARRFEHGHVPSLDSISEQIKACFGDSIAVEFKENRWEPTNENREVFEQYFGQAEPYVQRRAIFRDGEQCVEVCVSDKTDWVMVHNESRGTSLRDRVTAVLEAMG